MRSARVMLVGAAVAGALAGGCTTHTLRAEPVVCHAHDEIRIDHPGADRPCRERRACRACRPKDPPCRCRGIPPAGIRWDAVFPPPEVGRAERRYDRAWLAEFWRNDAALGARPGGPADAVAGSWPQPWRPDLDFDRTGRTSTSPERFIYSSRRPYLPWRSRHHYRR